MTAAPCKAFCNGSKVPRHPLQLWHLHPHQIPTCISLPCVLIPGHHRTSSGGAQRPRRAATHLGFSSGGSLWHGSSGGQRPAAHPRRRLELFVRARLWCAGVVCCKRGPPLGPAYPSSLLLSQVFRCEHWARTVGPRHALPMMSVVLAVTMVASLGASVLTHPAAAWELLQDPWLVQRALAGGNVPWQAASYSGFVTAACLVLEVRSSLE